MPAKWLSYDMTMINSAPILVVASAYTRQGLLAVLSSQLPVNILTAKNSAAALSLIRELQPIVVVIDSWLPELEVYKIIALVTDMRPYIKCVLLMDTDHQVSTPFTSENHATVSRRYPTEKFTRSIENIWKAAVKQRQDIIKSESISDIHQEQEQKPMEHQFVVFKLGEEHYGVDIADVESIIKMQPITGIPKAPEFIEGVTNLRGSVIPILDLRKRFEIDNIELTPDSRIVVINLQGTKVGMIVDAVSEVLQIDDKAIEPPSPMASSIDTTFITGIAKIGERLVILLDLDRVLSVTERSALETLPEPPK